jgi:hypothetical protein
VTLPRPTGPRRGSPLAVVPLEDPLANPRVRALACEIAYRLRDVYGHLPEGELVRLVTRLAVAQQGSASRDGAPRK